MRGIIHSYESLAALDGAGLRYSVFLAGCPLRCVYCHNPDTWTAVGEEVEPAGLARKIARYKTYFGAEGGVTFSGGEPLLQAEFINEAAESLREKGIGYALDTSGAVQLSESVKTAVSNADMVILDLKFYDGESYKKYTGGDIQNTLNMLEYLEKINKRTWLRTVVVPEINDSREILDKYLKHAAGKKCIEKYELLAFHTMGFYKYEKLGTENPLKDVSPLDAAVKEDLQKYVDEKMNAAQK